MGDILKKEMTDMVKQMQPNRVIVNMPELTEAIEDINDQIIDELITEIETAKLIKTDSIVDINLDLENLREWLQMYYRLEKK